MRLNFLEFSFNDIKNIIGHFKTTPPSTIKYGSYTKITQDLSLTTNFLLLSKVVLKDKTQLKSNQFYVIKKNPKIKPIKKPPSLFWSVLLLHEK